MIATFSISCYGWWALWLHHKDWPKKSAGPPKARICVAVSSFPGLFLRDDDDDLELVVGYLCSFALFFLSFLFCLWSSPHVVETRNFQQPWPAIAATATSCSHHICSILPHISSNPFPALLLCLLTLYPKIKVTARIEYDLTHRVCLYLFIHVGFSLCCFTFFFRRFDISSAVPSRFFSHECCEITFAMWLSVFCV